MNKIIISIIVLGFASMSLYAYYDIIGSSLDGDGKVCDAKTGICDGSAKQDTFSYATLSQDSSVLNKNYPAVDFVGLENWINSDGYDSLEQLRGQVVLIDFWTLGCVNCIRTLPHLVDSYEVYKKQGFEILAIHTPEFAYEKKQQAVQRAVKKYKLPYPVVQDNNFQTWKAYKNRYWPAHYLIDKKGIVRYTHFGEGNYTELNQAIEELLAEE